VIIFVNFIIIALTRMGKQNRYLPPATVPRLPA